MTWRDGMKLWDSIDTSLVKAFISILPKKWKYIKATNGSLWKKTSINLGNHLIFHGFFVVFSSKKNINF